MDSDRASAQAPAAERASLPGRRGPAPPADLRTRAGNRAVGRLLVHAAGRPGSGSALRRMPLGWPYAPGHGLRWEPWLDLPTDLRPAPTVTSGPSVEEVEGLAVDRLLVVLQPLKGDHNLGELWDDVVRQVHAPRSKPKAGLPAELYDARTVEILNRLKPLVVAKDEQDKAAFASRQRVLDHLFGALALGREVALGVAPAAGVLAAEWALLTEKGLAKRFMQPTLDYYATVRTSLLYEFGALDVGIAKALDRVIAYYGKLQDTTFLGHKVCGLHPLMVAALTQAEATLAGAPQPGVKTVEGSTIRFNANSPARLSEHSFGAAIDVNGATSPNRRDFPFDWVRSITGTDLREGAGRRKYTRNLLEAAPGSSEQLPIAAVRVEAERLYAASNVLEAAFADESGLGAALYWFARQRGWPDASPDEILAEAQAAAEESAKLRWSFKDPESKLDLKDRDYHHQWLGRLVFPALADQSPEPNHVKDTVDQMVGMVRTFAATFVKLKAGKTVRVEPTARDPSLAQLGLHGFMNVPPAVVAALSGHEGGNLRWLGGLPGTTRDYMHFELLERPPLF